ncbi:class I SAM-dependent methyltransferase [Kitasatospora sp. NPDC051914]|uniref:SAM-dependent methyltransferase n=1 Tax=Kitasatospora sp. NPDC051914 TaxID=3154945 RepID=UPI00343CB796
MTTDTRQIPDPADGGGERAACRPTPGGHRHGHQGHQGDQGHEGHGHRHSGADGAGSPSTEEWWDDRYGEKERIWSGNPNAALVREAADLPPGRALDLGCGEGADAVWLARQGWQVTAVDISRVALDRAAEHAEEAGVADLIDFRRTDLATGFPEGAYDLVSAQFLHSAVELPREAILRRAAEAVAPGGVLLVVGHSGPPSWLDGTDEGHAHDSLPTPAEVHEALRLPAGAWELLRSAEHVQPMTGPDGLPATRTDNTLMLRRIPA